MTKKILLIDDDPDLGRLVETVLRPIEATLYQSYSGGEGLRQAYNLHPDLVILDIMMPTMDGFEVCERLRELSNVPILMLTARSNSNDMVRGFNMGVDDFVKKPFANDELEARVRALLRRAINRQVAETGNISVYKDAQLEVDLSTSTVRLNGEILELSRREYSLLSALVQEQGRVLSHLELVRKAWGESFVSAAPSVTSLYIFYLRKKLNDGSDGHQYIHTFWGRGYWFEPKQEE